MPAPTCLFSLDSHAPGRRLPLMAQTLRRWGAALAVMLSMAACSTAPTHDEARAVRPLLHDDLFKPVPPPMDAAQVFAMTPEMRRMADEEVTAVRWRRDARHALMDALQAHGRLRLDYDDGLTRTAAEAFDSRAGNCLSLVVMTTAFAKYLNLPVRYQAVLVREQFSRSDSFTLSSGHVNVVLPRLALRQAIEQKILSDDLTVDFVPPDTLVGLNVRVLSEATVLAMFMNNRAVEVMTAGRPEEAYAWAREALRHDAGYLPGINTLGAIYLQAGHLPQAEAALRHVVERDPEDAAALSNLALTLRRAGREPEARPVELRLAEVQEQPPFHYLDLGRQAYARGELERARDLIQRELRRQPYQHEAHFWAAVVDATLRDAGGTEKHMQQAIEHSGTPQQQARYRAKLAALKEAAVR